MKNIFFIIMTFMLISCDMGDTYKGFVQDNDPRAKSLKGGPPAARGGPGARQRFATVGDAGEDERPSGGSGGRQVRSP